YFGIDEQDPALAAREKDRRQGAAARSGANRSTAATVRPPRRPGPREADSPNGPRSSSATGLRRAETLDARTEPPRTHRAAARGSSRDRLWERSVPRERRRGIAWHTDPPGRELPARVPRCLDAEVLLSATTTRASHRRGNRYAVARPRGSGRLGEGS